MYIAFRSVLVFLHHSNAAANKDEANAQENTVEILEQNKAEARRLPPSVIEKHSNTTLPLEIRALGIRIHNKRSARTHKQTQFVSVPSYYSLHQPSAAALTWN